MKKADRKKNADRAPVETDAPPELFQRRLRLRGAIVPLLALLTSVLLTVCFVGWRIQLPYLAYFALVPWGLALGGAVSGRWAIFWAWLAGVAFWAINLYWLWWITLSAYLGGLFYLSTYWLVAAIILRGASRRSWPMWICLPVVWVALEFVRGQFPVLGFPWLFVGHTQYCRPWLIQISDTTGQYGVSVIVALANGVVIDLLSLPLFGRRGDRKAKILRRGPCGAVAFAAILAGMLVYGWYRVEKQTGCLSKGPSMAMVQQAFPLSLYEKPTPQEKVFVDHLAASKEFIGSKCSVLFWAESMAPSELNPQGVDLMRRLVNNMPAGEEKDEVEKHCELLKESAEEITGLLKKLDCPMLTGCSTVHYDPLENEGEGGVVRRNSALLFNRSGEVVDQYSKRRLVPFSEYVPFKEGWPWLHRLLRGAVPPSMPQLQPGGEEWTPFKLSARDKTWSLASPICFEGTFADICRNMVVKDGKKVTHILVNLSNDGWFVWKYGDRPYRQSSEHEQHLVQYHFRAVENRVPVVRCVNTGVSASIDSNGREVARLNRHGNTMVSGGMLLGAEDSDEAVSAEEVGYQIAPHVLVDDRVTLYSTVGDVFAWMLVIAAAGLVAAGLWRDRVNKKKG